MRRTAAFTLVELLVVAAVGAGVVASAAVFLRQTANARERLDAAVAVNAEADAALAVVVEAMRHAVLASPDGGGEGGLRSLEDDPGGVRFEIDLADGGAGANSTITLNTWQSAPVRPGQTESDWREVELYTEIDETSSLVVPSPEGGAPVPTPSLKLRRDPTLQALEAEERGGVVETVAAGVVGFRVLAFDTDVQRWVEQWPPVENPTPRLPEAVRVDLTLMGEDGRLVRRGRLIGGFP